jgi:hypothetical protein
MFDRLPIIGNFLSVVKGIDNSLLHVWRIKGLIIYRSLELKSFSYLKGRRHAQTHSYTHTET